MIPLLQRPATATVLCAGLAALSGACRTPPPPPVQGAGAAAALAATTSDRLIDLSHPFDAATIYWPTARRFERIEDAAGMTPEGYWYAANSICASEHGGTHLDAPHHFARDGWTTDRIPIEALVAPLRVIDARAAAATDADHAVTVEEIGTHEAAHGPIPEGAIVVLFTGWGNRWPDVRSYLGDDSPGDASRLHFPGLSEAAARLLATERRIAGVGIDTASIDPGPSKDFLAHRALAAANVYILENLDGVGRLPATGATLISLPMKIAGGSGGPVRVLAVLP